MGMTKPWTLSGTIREKEIKMTTPVADDFETIRANIERIKKEEEGNKNGIDISSQNKQQTEQENAYYPSYYGKGFEGYSKHEASQLSLYEEMENAVAGSTLHPRIKELVEKYQLKIDNTSVDNLNKYYPGPIVNRILP